MVAIELTTNFMIPFLFVLAIVFGVLQVASPIKNKAANLIIAVTISFFASSYQPFLTILWSYLPSITWLFIVMFFIVFMMEIFGIRGKKAAEPDKVIISGVVLLILLTVGWSVIKLIPIEVPLIGSGENLILFFGIIFTLMVFWGAYKMGAGEPPAQK